MTRSVLIYVALCVIPRVAGAEPPKQLTLEDTIAFAAAQHPTVREDGATQRAAAAEVDVERAKFVPDVELFAQIDRSTANAAPGALFGVPNLPVVGGIPGRFIDSGQWGSAAGATASWDAIGFRRWDAMIDRARAQVTVAKDDASARQLDVEYAAADRFIAAVGRAQAVAAAKSGVDRAQVFLTIVKATVGADLRAGADLSRAEAELAFAQTAQVRAETAYQVSMIELGEALGIPGASLVLIAGHLDAMPPAALGEHSTARDPHRVAAEDRTRVARAEERIVATSTQPRINLVGALWMRGNGGLIGGIDSAHGLIPDVPNWALGVVLTWPVFSGRIAAPAARVARAEIEHAQAYETELEQRLQSRAAQADAILDGARRVSANTPLALRAAHDAEKQSTARYRASLATADDVAQTQRLLEQAEIDDVLARLDVWRALLLRAYAGGDLAPFLTVYRAAGP